MFFSIKHLCLNLIQSTRISLTITHNYYLNLSLVSQTVCCVNKSSNLNVVINVRMLPRNVIGLLLVAACFKRDRDASADWLPADAVGGSTCVVIGPFSACSAHSVSQCCFTHPTDFHPCPSIYSSNCIISSIHPSN